VEPFVIGHVADALLHLAFELLNLTVEFVLVHRKASCSPVLQELVPQPYAASAQRQPSSAHLQWLGGSVILARFWSVLGHPI
jgi:hypothetical protein